MLCPKIAQLTQVTSEPIVVPQREVVVGQDPLEGHDHVVHLARGIFVFIPLTLKFAEFTPHSFKSPLIFAIVAVGITFGSIHVGSYLVKECLRTSKLSAIVVGVAAWRLSCGVSAKEQQG